MNHQLCQYEIWKNKQNLHKNKIKKLKQEITYHKNEANCAKLSAQGWLREWQKLQEKK